MTEIHPNSVTHAADLDLGTETVPAAQVVSGEPRTGSSKIGTLGGLQVGVWEMTVGAMSDVEVDELFVVLSGAATVEFNDGTEPLQLKPGSVVTLAAGAETVWTVTETLRKVYLHTGTPG